MNKYLFFLLWSFYVRDRIKWIIYIIIDDNSDKGEKRIYCLKWY